MLQTGVLLSITHASAMYASAMYVVPMWALHLQCCLSHLPLSITMSIGACDLAGTTFTDNMAASSGGHVYVNGSAIMHADGVTFQSSKAQAGGSLYALGNATMVLNHTTIMGGQSTGYAGGCVYATGRSKIRLYNSAVSGCQSSMGGGGIVVFERVQLVLRNSTIFNNVAGVSAGSDLGICGGGAVAAFENTTISMFACKLQNNSACRGGAVYLVDQAQAEFLPPVGNWPGEHCSCKDRRYAL